MSDHARLLYGTDEPSPATLTLAAGPVTATLEDGALRWIRYDGIEVVRGIAFLVRDRAWNTALATIEDLMVEQTAKGFVVTFGAVCRTGDGTLAWRARIDGAADGTIRFAAAATPRGEFVTNRTGFVVLHPLTGVAGEPVDVTDCNGHVRRSRFPRFVDAEPCFTDVRALRYRVAGNLWATCTMEGDEAWETEDQRNWLDASFKTYVRPVRLPYPYALPAGATIDQSVSVTFNGPAPGVAMPASGEATVVITGGADGVMPRIGLRASPPAIEDALVRAAELHGVGAQILNATIDLRTPDWPAVAARAATLAEAIGAGLALQAILPCDDVEAEVATLHERIAPIVPALESLLLVAAETRIRIDPGPPPPPTTLLLRLHDAARRTFPGTRLGGGTLGAFAEFNRNLPPAGLVDFVAHTAACLVHAADDATLIENIESFADQAEAVRALCGAVPHRLAASGISIDEGPFCATVRNDAMRRATLASADPRERALFGAAWTLASLARIAAAGMDAVSPAAVAGSASVLAGTGLSPVGQVVAGLARAAGAGLMETRTTGAGVAALAYADGDATSLWIANLSPVQRQIGLPGDGAAARFAVLDAARAGRTAKASGFLCRPVQPLDSRSIEIGAFGVAHIRFGGAP